jgi:uncharacterized protein YueI
MELFKKIRLKIGNSILKKKVTDTKRKVHFSSFSLVKKIGIVWDASNTYEFPSLSRFYQKMHERSVDVQIIGYFPGKNLPDQYTAIRYLTCIRRKELNLIYQPVSKEAESFVSNSYDLLIDINFKKQFPLFYISSLSKSLFKVGIYEDDAVNSPFDLMIEIKNPVDVEDYLVQVIKYLEMINSGPVKQKINT